MISGLPLARIGALGCALLLIGGTYQGGCASRTPIRAQIVDAAGVPVSGAVLYFEVYRSGSVLDFGFAESDAAGFAPPEDAVLETKWGRGMRLDFAAFAPGKMPTVLRDALGSVTPEGIVIRMRDQEGPAANWEPRIATLSYPFETDPELFERAAAPDARILRQAFQTAYDALVAGGEAILPAEEAKLSSLTALQARAEERATEGH